MSSLIFTLAFAGFGALCLNMERHTRQVFGSVPKELFRLLALLIGWGLLAYSLVSAIDYYGVSVGITAWLGFLSLAAVAVLLLLTYTPRQTRYLVPGIIFLGINIACFF